MGSISILTRRDPNFWKICCKSCGPVIFDLCNVLSELIRYIYPPSIYYRSNPFFHAVPSSQRAFSSNNWTINGFESLDARMRYLAAQTRASSFILAASVMVTMRCSRPTRRRQPFRSTTALGIVGTRDRRARIGSETTYGWLADTEGADRQVPKGFPGSTLSASGLVPRSLERDSGRSAS